MIIFTVTDPTTGKSYSGNGDAYKTPRDQQAMIDFGKRDGLVITFTTR